ncbi:unnamed protein product [Ambrosiozyma monospora]|uniref:Unnamed protein product n=1 Tax=Ambrosiozyma monospora TaxID=43982 RepID=A0ACB5SSR1_AMBMO|nr:unnamed protein product [Ambrosiozyma monospora]
MSVNHSARNVMTNNGTANGGLPANGNNIHPKNNGVIHKNVEPANIPMPETVESLAQILRRFRELDTSKSYEAERLGILETLKKIDKEEETYGHDLEELSQLWSQNNEEVNMDLLKKQIIGLQMLSKDLDLPLELQLDFAKNGLSNEIDDTDSTEDGSAPLEIPLDDYEEKARCFGVVPNRAYANSSIHPVATKFAEEQLETKIKMRAKELESLPSNLGSYDLSKLENDLETANDTVKKPVDYQVRHQHYLHG